MKTKRHLLLLALVVALLAIPTFAVLAKELGSLTITGPGIKGELLLDDPEYMMMLEQKGFFDQSVRVDPPKNLNHEAGYSISAQLNLDGKMVPFVEMTYYPMEEGTPGYVHYTGRLQGETLQTVDQWHVLSGTADNAFRGMLTARNITLQPAVVAAPVISEAPAAVAAEPGSVPVASPLPSVSPYMILAIAAMAMLLAGAGLTIRRRTIGRTTT